jgi:hypothetical protein
LRSKRPRRHPRHSKKKGEERIGACGIQTFEFFAGLFEGEPVFTSHTHHSTMTPFLICCSRAVMPTPAFLAGRFLVGRSVAMFCPAD